MADRPVTTFGLKRRWETPFAEAVSRQAQAPEQRWMFALREAAILCVDEAKAQEVGHANRRMWVIFQADAVIAGCAPNAGWAGTLGQLLRLQRPLNCRVRGTQRRHLKSQAGGSRNIM